MADTDLIRARRAALSDHQDERDRRIFAAAEARTAGYGGMAAVARANGNAASIIRRGLKALAATEVLALGRIRCYGGGGGCGKRRVVQGPTLLADLRALVEPDARVSDTGPALARHGPDSRTTL